MKLLLVCLGFVALSASAFSASEVLAPVKNEINFTGDFVYVREATVGPVLKKSAPPTYPREMRRTDAGGEAEIAFIVNAKGQPEEVQIFTATNALFGEAAAKAVSQWRYKPGTKNGVPVRVALIKTVVFQIGDK